MTIGGGQLRSFGEIVKIISEERLRDLGFDILAEGKLTTRQTILLNRGEEELPPTSDLAKVDDTELQEYTENTVRSTRDFSMSNSRANPLRICPCANYKSWINSSEILGVRSKWRL